MAPHLLCVRASKADWSHLSISAGEDETICDAVNEAISAVADLTVVVAVIHKGHLDIGIRPAHERNAMLRQVGRFPFAGSKSAMIVYTICLQVDPAGAGCHVISPQDSIPSSRYKRRRNNQGGFK
jgi:hypothetical protein